MTIAERWQAWKDRQPHPEDWTVPGIAQRHPLDDVARELGIDLTEDEDASS